MSFGGNNVWGIRCKMGNMLLLLASFVEANKTFQVCVMFSSFAIRENE